MFEDVCRFSCSSQIDLRSFGYWRKCLICIIILLMWPGERLGECKGKYFEKDTKLEKTYVLNKCVWWLDFPSMKLAVTSIKTTLSVVWSTIGSLRHNHDRLYCSLSVPKSWKHVFQATLIVYQVSLIGSRMGGDEVPLVYVRQSLSDFQAGKAYHRIASLSVSLSLPLSLSAFHFSFRSEPTSFLRWRWGILHKPPTDLDCSYQILWCAGLREVASPRSFSRFPHRPFPHTRLFWISPHTPSVGQWSSTTYGRFPGAMTKEEAIKLPDTKWRDQFVWGQDRRALAAHILFETGAERARFWIRLRGERRVGAQPRCHTSVDLSHERRAEWHTNPSKVYISSLIWWRFHFTPVASFLILFFVGPPLPTLCIVCWWRVDQAQSLFIFFDTDKIITLYSW